MGLKQFNIDVSEAKSAAYENVTDIRTGDSEGEVVFKFTPASPAHPSDSLEIQALATGVDAYPGGSEFLIFTSTDQIDEEINLLLQTIAAGSKGKGVSHVIRTISNKLTARLIHGGVRGGSAESSVDITECEDNADSLSNSDDHDVSFDFSEQDDSAMDEGSDVSLDQLPPRPTACATPGQDSNMKLRKDLRAAKAAGFFIGLLSTKLADEAPCLVSLSIQVSKLGLLDESLEAWGLDKSEHIVLLMKLTSRYPSISEFLDLASDQTAVQFRFGKCLTPKPSLTTATEAFATLGSTEPQKAQEHDFQADADAQQNVFLPLHISDSLDVLLNQVFLNLLKLRRDSDISWDQAQALNHIGQNPRQAAPDANGSTAQDSQVAAIIHLPGMLQLDYALAPEQDLSIPLVAMHFGLQRLIGCTKYCMVCHQKAQGGFEAVKPYVCESPLCFYQYFSLGLGQSIEHEVINNPYVVDLLISFFHSAVASGKIREIPLGLHLKYPHAGSRNKPGSYVMVEANLDTCNIRFNLADYAAYSSIAEGNYVLLVTPNPKPPGDQPIHTSLSERYICQIESIHGPTCTFGILFTYKNSVFNSQETEGTRSKQGARSGGSWNRVMLFKYDCDIYTLDTNECPLALAMITHAIPSVLEMRHYLMEKPGRRLSAWKRIDRSTLALLNWIVSSNRSFIVQDSAVPGASSTDKNFSAIGEGWMRFRFAQGSPEKEHLFSQELELQKSQGQSRADVPSLFAFHGSHLGNWHSIIRTGLDYTNKVNGRSYGDGVYLSRDFAVSSSPAYSGMSGWDTMRLVQSSPNWADYRSKHPYQPRVGFPWPNSQLQTSQAVSLCEIVNRPDEFVSRDPHYVVNKPEWVQCRYLFVKTKPTPAALTQAFPKPSSCDCVGYVKQEVFNEIYHNRQTLQVPLSAIPARRRPEKPRTDWKGKGKEKALLDGDTSMNIKDDLDELDELDKSQKQVDEPVEEAVVRKRQNFPEAVTSAMSRLVKRQSVEPQPTTSTIHKETDFKPGTLNLNSLPKLAEPTWASSSPSALRVLNREVMSLQKVQSNTDLGTLGWYIDFDKFSNLFHWIVELHTLDAELPLAQDMKKAGCTSIVLEFRFGSSFPITPPFVRVIRPRFLPFGAGGGGHVTIGGAICSELLTNSGWLPTLSLEQVFIQVRLGLSELDQPARLVPRNRLGFPKPKAAADYGIHEALEAYARAARTHGWKIPQDMGQMLFSDAQGS
ncbi:hypothetical protein G7046_g7122 [Stylonectria norvegica]|nr:hypothetical protein G7046_g7122 [Stylonectria norvegica]